ncbi:MULTISPECIES: DUF1659 domain-containing protein [Halobacillus]|uniref:DUF1659 domain-containing protein n=1 Tax=Halobacillus halophilus (strain ATCC 35676 / DSM 2266 / JCM 20832 / KCTC 3685 / LMG 17431 / NBRC 102448 / NCIMB 2269) TaxID=866895 RepID=I0JLU6_HALH3|nr:DUF1659 domain-containing protein [Halobacillus halophilus]ASF39217.1 hypothetical protein CEH05_08820 [Halobacillus halophilus]CCG45116.1 hypothetical protein HBHAL_2768 [Halobacillus halophilus DSM 2266]
MAVSTEIVRSQLQLVLENGQDEKGNTIFRTKSFNNIKITASEDQLYRVATAMAPLQQHLLYAVERNDNSILIDL